MSEEIDYKEKYFEVSLAYLDLVELIKYHSNYVYEKIFIHEKPSRLKLMIDRVATGSEYNQLDYEYVKSQLEKYKQTAEYGLELASFYGDKDNYRVDKNHVKNVYFTEEIIGNEGRDLGKFARELKPKIEELLK